MIRKKRRAATIIEVVMAIVILSIALPPLISAFADAAHQSIHPSNAAIASFLATERMEEVIARRFRATDGYDAVTMPNFPNESPVAGFPGFDRTMLMLPVGNYKRVRVTVTWKGGANQIFVERLFAELD